MWTVMKFAGATAAALVLAVVPAAAQSSGGGGSSGGSTGAAGAGTSTGTGSAAGRGGAGNSTAVSPSPSLDNSPLNRRAVGSPQSNGVPGSVQPGSTTGQASTRDPRDAPAPGAETIPGDTSTSQANPEQQKPGGPNSTNAATDTLDPTGASGGTTSGGGGSTGAGSGASGPGTGGNGPPERAAYGANMDQCMSVWSADTHMTQDQWRQACERTTTR